MAVKYETKATNTGGRNGHVQTDDKAIDVAVIPPAQADLKRVQILNNYSQQVMRHALMVHLI